jgi:hypothetical protein
MLTKAQSKMLKMNYYAVLNSRVLLYFIFFLAIIDLLFFLWRVNSGSSRCLF